MQDFEDEAPRNAHGDFRFSVETGPGADYYKNTDNRARASETLAEARRKREKAARIRDRFMFGGIGLAVLAVLGSGVAYTVAYVDSARQVTATVTDKSCNVIGISGKSGCTYMLYTTAGVFTDSDSFLAGKYNSSDVYNQMQKGYVCTFNVKGFRIHITSSYPNIISVQDCKVPQ